MAKGSDKSANRKSDIISAAIEVFAEIGYYRATTAQVAERAGISQPYVFRFFASKEALMVAALSVSWERILRSFRRVTETSTADTLEADLIQAYEDILEAHQNETLLQMQAQTIREEAVREVMRNGFVEVNRLVRAAFQDAGMEQPGQRAFLFLARGMLCNIAMSLGLPELIER
ncbi:TetR/AcrR family transcriptional regulator [Paenibacillus chartarius]|uniref:TetR/AcrR family transcriptional regulator n=1 Tax=Paenibacillus chartarius TaxID=747481 RepID=A0ABV6DH98_9BACL